MVTRVLGYPDPQIPVSASFAATQSLKKEQIVYDSQGTHDWGTRFCRDPGTRIRLRLNHPPPGRVSVPQF